MEHLSSIKDSIAMQAAGGVRGRREQLGLTLRSLEARSGVSSSMISDIERGTKSPTISTLAALAEALTVPISAFVATTGSATRRLHVVRASERLASIDPTSGARRDSLGPALEGSNVELLRYVVPPHTVAGTCPAHASGTIEHIHLAAGKLRIMLGTDAVILESGASCSGVPIAPHGCDNEEGEVEAVLYIVIETVPVANQIRAY